MMTSWTPQDVRLNLTLSNEAGYRMGGFVRSPGVTPYVAGDPLSYRKCTAMARPAVATVSPLGGIGTLRKHQIARQTRRPNV